MRSTLLASRLILATFDSAFCQTSSRTIVREPSEPARWSLPIGVNDYMNVNDLQYCADDVEGVKERLEENGFHKRQQYMLRTGASDTAAWRLKPAKHRKASCPFAWHAHAGRHRRGQFSGSGWISTNLSAACLSLGLANTDRMRWDLLEAWQILIELLPHLQVLLSQLVLHLRVIRLRA